LKKFPGEWARLVLNSCSVDQQATRPFFALFPDFGVINQIQTSGNSNYNSLQTVLKVREWHRLTSQFAYTWAHGLDDMRSIAARFRRTAST
jgi:hypothetical protein